jgi:hypothetical protein
MWCIDKDVVARLQAAPPAFPEQTHRALYLLINLEGRPPFKSI